MRLDGVGTWVSLGTRWQAVELEEVALPGRPEQVHGANSGDVVGPSMR